MPSQWSKCPVSASVRHQLPYCPPPGSLSLLLTIPAQVSCLCLSPCPYSHLLAAFPVQCLIRPFPDLTLACLQITLELVQVQVIVSQSYSESGEGVQGLRVLTHGHQGPLRWVLCRHMETHKGMSYNVRDSCKDPWEIKLL